MRGSCWRSALACPSCSPATLALRQGCPVSRCVGPRPCPALLRAGEFRSLLLAPGEVWRGKPATMGAGAGAGGPGVAGRPLPPHPLPERRAAVHRVGAGPGPRCRPAVGCPAPLTYLPNAPALFAAFQPHAEMPLYTCLASCKIEYAE